MLLKYLIIQKYHFILSIDQTNYVLTLQRLIILSKDMINLNNIVQTNSCLILIMCNHFWYMISDIWGCKIDTNLRIDTICTKPLFIIKMRVEYSLLPFYYISINSRWCSRFVHDVVKYLNGHVSFKLWPLAVHQVLWSTWICHCGHFSMGNTTKMWSHHQFHFQVQGLSKPPW